MVLTDVAKVIVNPKPIMEKWMKREQFFSLIAIISIFSLVLAVASISFFRAEDMSKVLGYSIESDTYEAYKIFMMLGSGIVALFTPVVFILLNSIVNKLLLLLFRVNIPFRQLFILGSFAYIPLLMDTLLRIGIQLFTLKPLMESPAKLFPFLSAEDSPIAGMLSALTVFGIWSMLLYTLGIYLMSPENRRVRSVALVIVTWLASSLISGYIGGI
ncbi:hypothetical protein KZ483_08820 [Paenibacillus sp. sptzw28]|uniref:hypothetical protein n=1 Tax=Paenibacillus sp. sptzw28 TaxID=715179 RepID=UPI001C6EDB6A|nr:hypothetical protein [Paenibacillus sp. sptzw28]QYR23009.1 hypothetical protein KZ483_08820 [Paenibacillus sp. sptzw28]